MESITFRIVTLSDLPDLHRISTQTFHDTFAPANTAENIDIYLSQALTLDKLAGELLNPSSIFYFALDQDKIIGYLKLNFDEAQTDLKTADSLEIERIYVLQEHQGRRAGQMLLEHALNIAQRQHLAYAWLGVWEKNEKAIRFYQKNGFVEFDKHIFKLGMDEQTDILMKRNITERKE